MIGAATSIERVVPAANVANEPERRFLVDPRDHIEARRDARAAGLDVCGFYHSHPKGGAEPSPTDIAEAAYEGALYVIVGLAADPPHVRLFRLADGRFVDLGRL